MKKFVIDTTLFANPASFSQFGKSREEAVKNFIKLVKKLDVEIYAAPSIWKELELFLSDVSILEGVVRRKAPNIHTLYVPATVIYEFIDDLRKRINKGLRIAEEFARMEPDEKNITKLREKYRELVRHGLLDSTADLDTVLLAKELDAIVVSSDEGIIKMATSLGCEWVKAENFRILLENLK
jgi:RNA ligase partner protein